MNVIMYARATINSYCQDECNNVPTCYHKQTMQLRFGHNKLCHFIIFPRFLYQRFLFTSLKQ